MGNTTADRAPTSQPLRSNTAHTPAHTHTPRTAHTLAGSQAPSLEDTHTLTDRDTAIHTRTRSRDTLKYRAAQTTETHTHDGDAHTRALGDGGGVRRPSRPPPPHTRAPLPGCSDRKFTTGRPVQTLTTTRPQAVTPSPRVGPGTPRGGREATAATSKDGQLVATCGPREGGHLSRR